MSVDAISWALNLAPVPRDRGRKRNSACRFVLVAWQIIRALMGQGLTPASRPLNATGREAPARPRSR